jgi:hypothetical protein
MEKEKICNQFFVKDTHRDKKYACTLRCVTCDESSSLNATFPFEVSLLTDFIKNFTNLHHKKGCNKDQLSAPEWASGEFNVGIV